MSDPSPSPQVSPDGRFYWDGARWVQVPAAATNLIARGGRWFTRDEQLWWDGNRWLPYRRVTWNSIHNYSNPPEDRATLARNLGVWCFLFAGWWGLSGFRFSALFIVAAIAGAVSIFNGLGFFRLNAQSGKRFPGDESALAGIILSVVGLSSFLVAIVLQIRFHP
jgi:hypothetical protein